jgi:hypothetical protein
MLKIMKPWCSMLKIITIAACRSSSDPHSIGSLLSMGLNNNLDEVFERLQISLDLLQDLLKQVRDLMLLKPHQLEAINYFNLFKLRFLYPIQPRHVCSYCFEQLS